MTKLCETIVMTEGHLDNKQKNYDNYVSMWLKKYIQKTINR